EVFGIKRIDEKPEDLRRLRILIDGNKEHSYLLQIFMKDAATLYGEREAGPFFYEVIQRKADKGFRARNFRSPFQSLHPEHPTAAGRVSERRALIARLPCGTVPREHHIQLRLEGGALAFEECFTQEGFEGPCTIAYHLRAPHTQRLSEAKHGWTIAKDATEG